MSFVQAGGGPAELPQSLANTSLDAGALVQEAERLRRTGDLKRAQALCEQVLGKYQDFLEALQLLALVLSERGQHDAALLPAVRAVMLDPQDWYGASFLGTLLLKLGAYEMALRSLRQALERKPDEPGTLVALGNVYQAIREYNLATDAFRRALASNSSTHDARVGLGNSLMHLGDLSAAAAVLEEIVERTSQAPIATLYALGQLPPSLHKVDVLARAEAHRRGPQDSGDYEAMVAFTKAVALHWAGRHAECWKQLLAANSLIYPKHQEECRRGTGHLISFLSNQKKKSILPDPRISENTPIALFILGPSTSGKSTLERLVSSLGGVKRGFEGNIVRTATRRAFHYARLPPRDNLSQLPPSLDGLFRDFFEDELKNEARDSNVFTVTTPGNIQDAYRLATLVPNARFAFVKRDLNDVTFRIFGKKYKRGNFYAYNLYTIREYIDWYYGMIDALVEQLPGQSIVVHYEDVIAKSQTALAAVKRLCRVQEPSAELPLIGDDRGCSEPYRRWMEQALQG